MVITPLIFLTVDLQTYNVLEPAMATAGLYISTLALHWHHMQEKGPHTRKGPLAQEKDQASNVVEPPVVR